MPTAAGIYYSAYDSEDGGHPPVLLIHGAGGTHLFWPPQIRRLAGQRVYALDLPGHGRTQGVGKQSIEAYAEDIIKFMGAIKVPAAVMVGHSMGSAIALTLAIKNPKHVLSLGLMGSGAKLRVAPAILEAAANPDTFPAVVELITQSSYGQNADARLKELASRRLAETRPAVLYGDLLACDTFDVRHELEKVTVPVLILCGAEDRMTPLKYSEYLRDKIPAAQFEILSGAGHMFILEQAGASADVLLRFLDSVR